jgi:hypothetical protein
MAHNTSPAKTVVLAPQRVAKRPAGADSTASKIAVGNTYSPT